MGDLHLTWDPAKAASNRRRHPVSFVRGSTVPTGLLVVRFELLHLRPPATG